MTREEFVKYVKKIEILYTQYRKKFLNKDYIISFSNGETINFKFYEENFAHLIGVQIRELKEKEFVPRNLSTNYVLEFIISNPISFYKIVNENGYKIDCFISKYYRKKIMALESIEGFLPLDFEFVIEYDKEKANLINKDLNSNVNYLFGYKLKDGYAVIGITQSEKGYFYPLTVLGYEGSNKEKVNEILKYQNLVIPIYTRVVTKDKVLVTEFIMQNSDKISKLKVYEASFTKKYKCITNMSGDYIKQVTYFTNRKMSLEKELEEIKNENYNLYMTNIKLKTENKKFKENLERIESQENTEIEETLENQEILYKIKDDKYLKLKSDIFDGESIEDEIIDRAFKALTNKERTLLEYYYGLNGKNKLSWKKIANIYEISSIQYTLNKLKKDFKMICLGLKTKNPYIELLTDREKLLKLAFTLPKEERDVFILKNGLFTCNRASYKEISEELGIPYVKVKKVVESAEEKVIEMVKR